MRVLIVQSNEPLGRIWQRHLQRLGANVDIALTGSEAVEAIETTPFENARAFIETNTPPGDLAAIVQHYGGTVTHVDEVRKNLVSGLSG